MRSILCAVTMEKDNARTRELAEHKSNKESRKYGIP